MKGTYNGRVVFDDVRCENRTDDAFASLLYMGTHQLERSCMLDYNIKCVSSFVLD